MNMALRPLPTRVTQQQYAKLAQARDNDGLSIQEHVRRALDVYLSKLDADVPPQKPAFVEPPPKPKFVRRKPRVTRR